MLSRPATTTPATEDIAPVYIGTDRVRATIVALILAIGAIASAIVVLWQPWQERDQFSYAALASVRDAVWAGSIIDGLALAAVGVTLGLAVCLLAPARGSVWANIGAVLSGLGGVAFCAGISAHGVLTWYATATEAIPADAGTTMMAYVEDNFGHVAALHVSGFLLLTLGSLLLMVALWRARSVPRWLPIAFLVLTVAVFTGLSGRLLDIVQAVQILTYTVVAWYLWRAAGRTEPTRS
jgi:uncharacterized membrane protein